ncbi:U4 U6.U5 tri-snRNP-associated protein [Coemansia biformis]|uniref:U4 U6.U5 tri-snRNP-associated protein n=1 Tax=Coemansia biformis TaxID=1286918 RepID=A0A9W7YE79_9FUNG|nr:U4 U6.U5 tri-snRNP-associated protein [Coemansia biformis]
MAPPKRPVSGGDAAASKQRKLGSANPPAAHASPSAAGSDEDAASDSDAATCPHIDGAYLDTVNRACLDFDFEQLCSVSLSSSNIYACLVCGKYYQGRGKQTQAYFHSINDSHHVFINLRTLRAYVLPDGYEVKDRSLNDIKNAVQPQYSPHHVAQLDTCLESGYDLGGKPYRPGFVGLNRIKHNSYMNAVVQALAHVPPIRDMLLLLPDRDGQPALLQRMAVLVRKMWHGRLFKAHVSPHEFAQEVADRSRRRFRLDVEGDAFEFLTWLLNTLHMDLGGTRKKGSSVIYTTFQGQIRATTHGSEASRDPASEGGRPQPDTSQSAVVEKMPFLALSLELPPKPLFTSASVDTSGDGDGDDRTDIPQVALTALLQRYNGSTAIESNGKLRQYQPVRLPQYIICHIKRFSKGGPMAEKNPTVVNFPIHGVRFGDLLPCDASQQHCRDTTYDLIVNICHIGQQMPAAANTSGRQSDTGQPPPVAQPDTPTASAANSSAESPFVAYIRCSASGKWYMLRDLHVEPAMPQVLCLSDSYIQIWQRNDSSVH